MKKIRFGVAFFCVFFFAVSLFLVIFPRVNLTSVVKNHRISSTIEVFGDKKVEQSFNTNIFDLKHLYITLAGDNPSFDGTVDVNLYKNKKLIYENSYVFDELEENIIAMDFDDVKAIENDKFSLEIQCSDCTEDSPLALGVANEVERDELLHLNHDSQMKALTMTLFGKHYNYNYVIFSAVMFLVMFFILCFMMIQKKRANKIYFYYILEFIFSLFSIILLIKNICGYLYDMRMNFWLFFLCMGGFVVLIYLFVRIIKSLDLTKQQLYLGIAIPIALGYAIMMLPNYVADEPTHFFRAYNLIDHNILSRESDVDIPKDFLKYDMSVVNDYSNLEYMIGRESNYCDEIKTHTSADGYAFPLYLFADIGILIGKLFSLPFLITYYLARIFNAIGMLLFGYLIVKFLPFGKNVGLIYLLNPMYLHQGVSISADSMVNSICLLFISLILNLRNKKELNRGEYIFLFAIIILLGFAKYIYLPLILLLVLFIPNRKRMSKNLKRGLILTSIIAIFLCAVSLISIYVLPAASSGNVTVIDGIDDVNMLRQLKYILMNPIYAVKTFSFTMYAKLVDYVDMFFGLRLGWLNISVHKVIIWVYVMLFLSSPFIYDTSEFGELQKKEKWLCNILGCLLFVLAVLSMWLCWTPIGTMPVLGVQGRYFLPFMLLPMLSLVNRKQKIKISYYEYKLSILMLFLHMGVLACIIYYFV